MYQILFEWLQFAFEWLESLSMARICIWMLLISFEGFESLSNRSNLDWNASNSFLMVRICIRMLRISFECLEFACETFLSRLEFGFECIESLSNSSNLHSNVSNPFWRVGICIWILRILFEGFEFAFECFGFSSNG